MDALGQGPHGQPPVLTEFLQQPVIGLIQGCHLSSGRRFEVISGIHLSNSLKLRKASVYDL
jgi:hypothetical protein